METRKRVYKVVILGGGRVGKTSLLLKFVKDRFNERQTETINADFLEKRVSVDDVETVLNIWDTAGQETFKSIAPIYYRKASAVVIVFDITERHSFMLAQDWVKEVAHEGAVIVLVGNKCDLVARKQVEETEVQDTANSLGVKLYYTSAKSGGGVEELFRAVARQLLEREQLSIPGRISPKRVSLKVVPDNKPKKSPCC